MANHFSEQLDHWKITRKQLDFSEDLARKGWYHSFELPDGRCFEGHTSVAELKHLVARMRIPENLSGKRVLDIGAWDGWYSFEMERRGAEVVAIDCVEMANFRFMQRELGSHVEYRIMDMYDLSPEKIGYFDIVLFLGVLYHLKHPLLALEKVCAVTGETAIISSFITDDVRRPAEELVNDVPRMEFYETDELGGQLDNWFGPNLACLFGLCRAAGFARADLLGIDGVSAMLSCCRRWEPVLEAVERPPVLKAAVHSRNYGINFQSARDDYIACWFTADTESLTREQVFPEVGGYGVRPVFLIRNPDGIWQCNFRLPPGLLPGWHSVLLGYRNSGPSNATRIAVDMPLELHPMQVVKVLDGVSFEPNVVCLKSGGYVCLWVSGLPENADRNNVGVFLDSPKLTTEYVSPEPCEAVQVNARLPKSANPGAYLLKVRLESVESTAVPVLVE